jgi:hypothetical protein
LGSLGQSSHPNFKTLPRLDERGLRSVQAGAEIRILSSYQGSCGLFGFYWVGRASQVTVRRIVRNRDFRQCLRSRFLPEECPCPNNTPTFSA